MPRLAANLSLMFTELDFLDRFGAAARAGFRGVEFLFPYAWPAAEIHSRLEDAGLQQVLFNISPGDWDAGERGLAGLAGREDDFAHALDEALAYAETLRCPRLHAMSGLNGQGARRDVLEANIEKAALKAASAGIEILVEPINTFDMPDYFLSRTEQAADIIAAVGLPNIGLQLDLYHRYRMEGDAEGAIARYAGIVRHYQIAGPPDRGEPIPSDLDVSDLFGRIDASGYKGWVGCEYRPRGRTEDGLAWMRGVVQHV
ncbi:MAG: 2-oxo-tetronate isomerase [Hyphomicrobiaceae bacterium]